MCGWLSDEITRASRSKRFSELLVLREPGGEHLDRDVAAEPRVARAPHFAHAAGAERRCDLVRSQALTRR